MTYRMGDTNICELVLVTVFRIDIIQILLEGMWNG